MTTSDAPTPPLAWTLAVDAVPERGGPLAHTATAPERAAVLGALSLTSLETLSFTGRIERLAGGRYRVSGRVKARLEQACVITLDPVAETIDEPMDVEFRPADLVTAMKDVEVELDEAAEVEPIERGRMAIGRVVYETLAAGLNPYPRKDGETFDEMAATPKGAAAAKDNPFAVLGALKPKT